MNSNMAPNANGGERDYVPQLNQGEYFNGGDGGGGPLAAPQSSVSSSPPPDYASRQHPSQPQPQHHQSLQSSNLPPPPRLPPPSGPIHGGGASSLPWTVGSTDGSFATMTLMQQQQQQQHADSTDKPSKNGVGGATIGAAGEANSSDSVSENNHNLAALSTIQAGRSLYHDRLFHQSSSSVESILTSSCDVMGFDIAEMWLRTGPKTHQLTNSHLRPTALEDSVRKDLVEVYYGEKSNERTHRLSPALCKRAKDANDVVWVTAHTKHGAEALRMSISNVRTAVAVPVCHEASNTNITIIYFSIRRCVLVLFGRCGRVFCRQHCAN